VVADLCDTVTVMRAGEVVESAPAAQLFADPQHDYTRSLLAATLEGGPARAALTTPAGGTR
jgi:peptide/nickel transport system permease protein